MASTYPYPYRASHDEHRHGAGTAPATNFGGGPPRSAMGPIGRSRRTWRCRWPWPGLGDRSIGDSHRLRRAGAVQRRRNRPLHRRVVAARRFALVATAIDHPANCRQRRDPALGTVVVQWQRTTSRCWLGRSHRPPRCRNCAVARPGTARRWIGTYNVRGAGNGRRRIHHRSLGSVDDTSTRPTAPPATRWRLRSRRLPWTNSTSGAPT